MRNTLAAVLSVIVLVPALGPVSALAGTAASDKPSVSLNTEPIPKPIPWIKPKPKSTDAKCDTEQKTVGVDGKAKWPIVGDLGKCAPEDGTASPSTTGLPKVTQ